MHVCMVLYYLHVHIRSVLKHTHFLQFSTGTNIFFIQKIFEKSKVTSLDQDKKKRCKSHVFKAGTSYFVVFSCIVS